MTKPIAQTFYVNEPSGGVEGVILTAVDIYFESVSAIYGVELQIRTTENGNPTNNMLPYASCVLQVTDQYSNGDPIIVSSAKADKPTKFSFRTPVVLQSQTSYALIIIPLGGNPDYTVWTAEIGMNDVTTSTASVLVPIATNNDTGTLFLSSNDIQFTAVQSEDIKFTLYTADFIYTSGKAAFRVMDQEPLVIKNIIGNFIQGEKAFVTNGIFSLAALSIGSNVGIFNIGENIYQSNGTANTATGVIYSANTSQILITNSTGSWTTSYQAMGDTSGANAIVSYVSQNVITYSNSTVVVPFIGNTTANLFYANQSIYIATNSRSVTDVLMVNTIINSTSFSTNIKLHNPVGDDTIKSMNVTFTDTNAIIGPIRGDGLNLYGNYYGTNAQLSDVRTITITNPTSNGTSNFTNVSTQYIVGFHSQASAYIIGATNIIYHSVVPQINYNDIKSGAVDLTFKGKGINGDDDPVPTAVYKNQATQFKDKARSIRSRSIEITSYSNIYTTHLFADINTSNNKISPVIDASSAYLITTRNSTVPIYMTSGFRLDYTNATGLFSRGDSVSQSNGTAIVTGTILNDNRDAMTIVNISGPFNSGYSIYATSNNNINALAISSTHLHEKYSGNVVPNASRYISKSVILAEGQDAEDFKSYMAAYRPQYTDFKVYCKVVNNQDTILFNNQIWSRMTELSSPALLSSSVNINDLVELEYGLPSSQIVLSNEVSCNITSNTITMTTTSQFSNGDFVYLYNTSSNTFIVRQISSVTNATALTLEDAPTFISSNADIGIIPGIEDRSAVFSYTMNNGISRYVSRNDIVYDGFKTFALKIAPVSSYAYIVPRMADMRCLALQV